MSAVPQTGRVRRFTPVRLVVGFVLLAAVAAALVVGVRRAAHGPAPVRNAIVLVPLAGPESLTTPLNAAIERAVSDAAADSMLRVRRVAASISKDGGNAAVRAIGDRERAALVVWGYVDAAGADAIVSMQIENMAAPRSVRFRPFGDYGVEAAVAEPGQFVYQGRAGGDAGDLVRLVQAVVRYRRGDDAAADRLFAALQEAAPSEGLVATMVMRGNLALVARSSETAFKFFDGVLQGHTLAAEAHNGRGLAYAGMGEQDKALAEYDLAAGLDPEDEAPHLNRGVSFIFRGEHRRAVEVYDAVLERSPRATAALVGRGVAWAALGEHKRAQEDFSRAIALAPNALAYYDRGLSKAALANHREAIDDFSRALEMAPADPMALVGRGRSRSTLKDQPGAIADFTAALAVDPKMAAAYYERGIARTIQGQYRQADEDFSAAIALNPRYGDAYKGRGVSRLLQREYTQALDDFEHAIAIDPNDAEAYYQHGITLRLRGEPRKAIPDMQKVLEVSRDPSLRKQAEEQLRQIRAEP